MHAVLFWTPHSRIYRMICHGTMAELDAPFRQDLVECVKEHMDPMPQFDQSFWANKMTLMKRQIMITLRNRAFIRVRGIMVIIIGLLYGSSFFDLEPTSVQVVMGILLGHDDPVLCCIGFKERASGGFTSVTVLL
jgi:hypothetical protein